MEYNKKETFWKHKQEIQLYAEPIEIGNPSASTSSRAKARTKYEDMDLRDKIVSDKRRKSYYKRRLYYLTDLAIQNDLYTFITLTFTEQISDYSVAQKEWDLFLKRLKYQLKKPLKYIAVHEIQKKRSLKEGCSVFHFHMLCDLGYFRHKDLQKIWGKGFVFIEQIDTNDEEKIRRIMYTFKYIAKDVLDEHKTGERDKARKIYVSRNLKRPIVKKSCSEETMEDIVFLNMENILETSSYDMKNYKGIKINEVDSIKISRKE